MKLFTILLLAVSCAPAVELQIQFGALERMLGEQVFTQEGRRYVRGSKAAKCNFAYLEKPRVESRDGRLRIHARFTGRSAANLFGGCVGLGDAFDLTITATPQMHDSNLVLREVTVASDHKDGFYIRRVCAAMASSLQRDFKYSVVNEVRKILEDPGDRPQYKRELRSFSIPEVRVSTDALVLVLDFQLAVK
jgi:hypothetical protein